MANKVLLKKSSVAAKVPLVGDLDYGEIALNYTDEKLYFKNASNVIKSFNVGAVGTTTNALTIGTGLSGTSFNGSAAVTVAIDSTVATLTGTQTLTNKTLSSATLTGTLTAGGGVGTNGQVLTSTVTGVQWSTVSSSGVAGIDHQTYTATAAQTTFAVTYTAPYVNVFVNGVRLSPADYTAANGTSVVLATACSVSDIVNLVGFSSISVGYGLPSLTGNSGKYLTTDGSTVSWGTVAGGGGTTTNALTIGTGLSGTSFNGSSAVTVAIDSTVATLTGTQTLTNKTLTSPVIGTIVNTGTLTLPTSTDTLVGRATTDTLTNKTLTSPTINSVTAFSLRDLGVNAQDLTIRSLSNIPLTSARTLTIDVNNASPTLDIGGNITTANDFTTAVGPVTLSSAGGGSSVLLPQSGTLATLAGTETLTNKTLSSAIITGTLTAGGGVGTNGQVLQSTVTGVQWATVSGGGGTTTNALTIGTGLSGTSFNGSAAVTVAIDSTVATLTGTQTLTNKTLTSPTINSGAVSGTFTGAPTFSDTTASTSSTTGAVKIGGGLGVAGNIYVGSASKVGFVNASNVSVVYQVYNATAGSLDTVFG